MLGGDTNNNVLSGENAGDKTRQTQQLNTAQRAQVNMQNEARIMSASVAEQISVKILKAIQAGNDHIKIQLKPAELGRVEVKMEMGHDGRVMAIVTADSKETLDLLRRDVSDLQRALSDTGLELNSGDLTFNLRGDQGGLANSEPKLKNKDSEEETLTQDNVLEDMQEIFYENRSILSGRIDVKA